MYSTGAVMALVWQMHRLLVKLPNFSCCFSKSIISFISISSIQCGRNRPPGCDFVIYQIWEAISVSKGAIVQV